MKILIIVVIILLILCIICGIKKNNKEYFNYDYPIIDIVYTWVDNTKEFQEERNVYYNLELNGKINPSEMIKRFESNGELKYSIRSLEKYFPFYRNIYIVVKDGQFPSFLKKEGRLKIINHSDIMPKESLPTFNSMSIESCIHKINGLSEYYLYLNDDCCFLKHTNPSFFINKITNNPFLFHRKKKLPYITTDCINTEIYNFENNWYCNYSLLDNMLGIKKETRNYGSHVPKMWRKSNDYKIEEILSDVNGDNLYYKTTNSKFRKNDNLQLNTLLKNYLYSYYFNSEFKFSNELYINSFEPDKIKDVNKYLFMCINNIDKNYSEEYRINMEGLFPEKSKYEV